MNQNDIITNEVPQQAEKKTWVKPEAKTEQVATATLILNSGSADGVSCHS